MFSKEVFKEVDPRMKRVFNLDRAKVFRVSRVGDFDRL